MIQKKTFKNGLRLVYEKIPFVRSISLGIWVGTGSRNETIQNNGVSHFIEHMMFKGTKNRTAKQIAEDVDNIGGQMNAFTSKECTCYYAKVLDTHFDTAMNVLSDIFFNSLFNKNDIDMERKVIFEEIGMYEDSPEELVHDIISEATWMNNSLGYPILGTIQSLNKIDKKIMKEYLSTNYTPHNTVVAIAGNFDEEYIISEIEKIFGEWKSEHRLNVGGIKADFNCNSIIKKKQTEQVHMCMAFEGIESGNSDIYSLLALNNIFGSGMSSNIFQKIREEHGLVYSIFSYPQSHINAGVFNIYAGMNPEYIDKVINLVGIEIEKIKKENITFDQLKKSKEQLKSSLILALESSTSRMNSIGKSELILNRMKTPEEIIRCIDEVNLDRVREVTNKIFDINRMSFSAVGKIEEDYDYRKNLK